MPELQNNLREIESKMRVKNFATNIVFILSLTTPNIALSQGNINAKQTKTRAILQEIHQRQKNVGLSTTVIHRGKIVYSESLGLADIEHQIPVSNQTRFQIASTTKAFTGAALIKLFEARKIDLDTEIQTYISDFPRKSQTPITPKLLSIHLAGIRHYKDYEKNYEFLFKHYSNLSDAINLFKNDDLVAEPNTKYSYSSYGYNLLALVVQNASQKSYPEFVEETVLNPLNLGHTQFDDTRFAVPKRARLYSFYDPINFASSERPLRLPDFDYSYNMGGGNLLTTSDDLAKFGQAFVKEGFFKKEILEMFYRKPSPLSRWSYGWFVREKSATESLRIHITGAFPGVQSCLFVYPENELVIAILSNTWGIDSKSGELVSDLPEKISKIWI